MKVTYEFNSDVESSDDYYYLKVFQKSNEMHAALLEIDEYIRGIRKGRIEDDVEKMTDLISDIIYESHIGDIE